MEHGLEKSQNILINKKGKMNISQRKLIQSVILKLKGMPLGRFEFDWNGIVVQKFAKQSPFKQT